MKNSLTTLLILAIVFVLACAKKETALERWKDHYSQDPIADMKLPERPPEQEAEDEVSKKSEPNKKNAKTAVPREQSNATVQLESEKKKPRKLVTITSDNVRLRKGPGTHFKISRVARKGDVFALLQTRQGKDKDDLWNLVEDSNGKQFFVSSRYSLVTSNKENIQRGEQVSLKRLETIFDPTPPLPPELVQAQTITLNFEGTEVYDVITTFCELLKLDYVIEGPIEGKITLQTFNNILVQDLYSVLEQILAITDITVVKSGNFYRFLPIKDAIKKPVSIHFGNQSELPPNDRLIIQIIPLKYISADSMKNIITPLLTDNATFLDVPETNNLMLVELASNVKRIVKVVAALDIDKLSRSDVQLYKISSADADLLAEEMIDIFSTIGYKDVIGESLNFLPIERINSLLVVNSFKEILPTIEFWIDKLDQPTLMGISRLSTYVYYVQNGDADELASLLTSVFKSKAKKKSKKKKKSKSTDKDDDTTSTSKTKSKDKDEKKDKGLAAPKTKLLDKKSKKSSTKIETADEVEGDFKGELTVISDKDTNSLIIRTNARNYPTILELLKKLDLMPQQVLIEVLIIDLTLDEDVTTGLEMFVKGDEKLDEFAGGSSQGGQTVSGIGALLGSSATTAFTSGLNFLVEDPGKFTAFLQALETDSVADVLANPILVTSDNKSASISITDEIPIVTTTVTTGTASVATPEIEFRSVGVILTIEPKINKGGFVNLKIEQEISNLGATDSISGQPTFNTRTVSTEVVLKDNQSLIMGGLMRTRTTVSSSGIPILKNIPYMGRLFGSNTDSLEKSELMLFITPHVMSNTKDSQFVTHQFQNRISGYKGQMGEDSAFIQGYSKPARINKILDEPLKPINTLPRRLTPPSAQTIPQSQNFSQAPRSSTVAP